MGRKITEAEKVYTRVREAVKEMPPDVLASLRIHMMTPKWVDTMRKQIRRRIGLTSIEHNETGYYYCFWYEEKEFDELMKQII